MKPPPCAVCLADCCSDVLMLGSDIDALQELSPKDLGPDKVKRLLRDQYLVVGQCPWLLGNKCSVYEYRPMVCKVIGSPLRPCHKMPEGHEKIERLFNVLKRTN